MKTEHLDLTTIEEEVHCPNHPDRKCYTHSIHTRKVLDIDETNEAVERVIKFKRYACPICRHTEGQDLSDVVAPKVNYSNNVVRVIKSLREGGQTYGQIATLLGEEYGLYVNVCTVRMLALREET